MTIHAPNYTQIPNVILDSLPLLSSAEFKVVSFICRHTFGFHREKARMSLTFIMNGTGLSRQGVINAAESLKSRDWIEKTPSGDSFEYNVKIDSIEGVVNSVDQSTQLTRGSQLSVPPQSTQLTRGSQLSVPEVVNSVDSNKEKKKKKEREEAIAPAALPNIPAGYVHPTEKTEARFRQGSIGRFWPQLQSEGLAHIWVGPGRNDFDERLITGAIAHLKKHDRAHERGDALQYIRNCIMGGKFGDIEARMDESEPPEKLGSDGRLAPTDERERGKNWHEKQCWAQEWQEFAAKAREIGVAVEPQASPSSAFFYYTLPGSKTKTRTNFVPSEKFMRFTLEGWKQQVQGVA